MLRRNMPERGINRPRVPVMTTLRAASASLAGIRAMRDGFTVKPLQEWQVG